MANRFYLVPVHEQLNNGMLYRWPEYFAFDKLDPPYPGIEANYSAMDYGFIPSMLLLADLTQTDHDSLIAHADVYLFPPLDQLNTAVDDQDIDIFFEAIHIPTDWLTPSTTWLELLRQLAGMFQFNQRYGGIAAEETNELHSLFDNITLDDTYSDLTAQEKSWFDQTVAWFEQAFGIDAPAILPNMKFRLLVKSAGSFWDGRPFYLGGYEF